MNTATRTMNPCPGEVAITVTLPSGNKAVYLTKQEHIPRDGDAQSYQLPSMYGKQLGVRVGGDWFEPGMRVQITDLRRIALLERAPEY